MRLLSLLFLFTGAASAASKADLQRRDAGVVHDGQENKGLGLAPTTQLQSDHVPQLTRRDVRLHTVVANESANIPDLEQYVKSKIQPDEEKTIYPLTLEGKTFGWSGVVVDDAAKEEIAKQKGVVGIRESLKAHKKRALPQGDWSQKLTRRAGKWVKQEDSDEALNVDSQYLPFEYVYVPDAGKNTFIYVVDYGVNLKVLNELEGGEREFVELPTNLGTQILQTQPSRDNNEQPGNDDDDDPHGTTVASKAAGKQFGVAKAATIISVKLSAGEDQDWERGIDLVVQDLLAHTDRQGRSVVVSSIGVGEGLTHESATSDDFYQKLYAAPIKKLHEMGVPFVAAAGNEGLTNKDPNDPSKGLRDRVEDFPSILADADFPIITIGSASYSGRRSPWSQIAADNHPDQVTLYAPGERIECQSKVNGRRQREANGDPPDSTSLGKSPTQLCLTGILTRNILAAPQVAGIIATYLSYDTDQRPWKDLTGVARVKEIIEYIQSDQSSWARVTNGVRLVWNGATKEDHDSADDGDDDEPETPSSPAPRTKALSIILQNEIDQVGNVNKWLFYVVNRGDSPLCKSDKDALSAVDAPDGSTLVDEAPWPGGEYKLTIDGLGDCAYKNGGNDAGALWCGERAIPCYEEDLKAKGEEGTKTCEVGDVAVQHHPIAYCKW